ncbi:hypothetical protein CBR58_04325 [Bacillus thuringiensis]|uniref:Uncharacterized protein n=1 Tax=Bacillus thuringiensis TaxID=1428 RepID=A0A9X6Z6B4_BACTU|nr:hypothetical protein A3L20_14635 [Bacillus thuringiensis]OTZ35142.1 hypothetical protein BK763_13710 [Bacillus thuringiensis serovar thompsoni]MBG9637672.1 hypothetical protein [Bacillus thuringiensis]MBG9637817.1 hypothetical protein [Bacillus thuringiensis]MBG9674897.1 hypothetical protein [Bacillus thuringiensis]
MVRHLRLRQVLISQGYTRKELRKAVAFEHKNWKEDGESLPTIEQVRKMHETLGTWDKFTYWFTWEDSLGRMNNEVNIDGSLIIYPKANYKHRLLMHRRWKEHERRTLELFIREGC